MGLLLVSSFLTDDESLAYGLLLLATASLGAGFGFTVPALNTFTAAFNPTAVDRSILVLNALLGLGTVLAPGLRRDLRRPRLLVGSSGDLGDPARGSHGRKRAASAPRRAASSRQRAHGLAIPRRFWMYAGFAVLYGICETVNGNWAQLDMTSELGRPRHRRRSPSRRSGQW